MKKTIAAITAGLLLVAGQAAAQNYNATARVGDRIGANAGESSEVAANIPLPVLLAGSALLIFAVGTIFERADGSESN
jgi:hypothetical protein